MVFVVGLTTWSHWQVLRRINFSKEIFQGSLLLKRLNKKESKVISKELLEIPSLEILIDEDSLNYLEASKYADQRGVRNNERVSSNPT